MRAIARLLGLLSLVGGSLHFFRVTSARGAFLLLAKMTVGAAAPYLALAGAMGGILGVLSGAWLASLAAWLGAFASAQYTRRASAPHDGFERAFGADWEARIPPDEAR